jgi:hypothetical protein
MAGKLVLSFDFELAWGCRRDSTDGNYGAAYTQTHQTVTGMLDILRTYRIPATWATVGAIMLDRDWDFSPAWNIQPKYPFFRGSWYAVPKIDSPVAEGFYAPRLIEAILSCPEQEIGCHTFTHVYASDAATLPELLDYELTCCRQVADKWGIHQTSIVFPQNKIAYLAIAKRHGFSVYRGPNTAWYYWGRPPIGRQNARGVGKLLPYMSILGRYVDERIPLAPSVYDPQPRDGMVQIIHSAFLPGFEGVSKYISVQQRVSRIVKGLRAAARTGKVLSVYFHPCNFNIRRDECLRAFGEICRAAADMRERGELVVAAMRDFAQD